MFRSAAPQCPASAAAANAAAAAAALPLFELCAAGITNPFIARGTRLAAKTPARQFIGALLHAHLAYGQCLPSTQPGDLTKAPPSHFIMQAWARLTACCTIFSHPLSCCPRRSTWWAQCSLRRRLVLATSASPRRWPTVGALGPQPHLRHQASALSFLVLHANQHMQPRRCCCCRAARRTPLCAAAPCSAPLCLPCRRLAGSQRPV